jgi:hypothetical protein
LTVAASVAPTRFAGFLSDDEQAWLAGTGERPQTVAEQLPPRAAGLVPRAGQGDWVGVLRHERVRVVDAAVVRIRRRRTRSAARRGHPRRRAALGRPRALAVRARRPGDGHPVCPDNGTMRRMSHPRAAPGAVDIQPAQPVDIPFAGVPGGLRSLANRLRFVIDPAAGVARWTNERRRTVELPLPGGTSGRGVVRVVVVTANRSALYSDEMTRRIVFVDGDGRSLASSVPLTVPGFDALWPAGIFDPLREVGIAVESREVRNQHQVNRAFPGASRHWRLITSPWNWLVYMSWVVVPAVVFSLLIAFGVIS